MLVPSKVVSCIINPNYQRNSFWNMDDATDSTPIDTDPTWDSDAPPEVIHLYQVCDTNTWWIQNECIMNPSEIHQKSIMNPRSMPFTTLLWCRPLRSSASQSMSAVVPGCEDCEALRKQTRWQRPLSIADSMKQKQVGGLNGFRTELNWTDEWIDGLMLTLMDVFFFHIE